MNKCTNALHRAALGTCILSALVLSPLSAQGSSAFYSMDARTRSTRVASLPATCATDLRIADTSVVIEEIPEPIYVHSLSRSEISSLESETSGQVREVIGLTVVVAGGVRTHITEALAQSSGSCAVVESVRILPMKEITVYLAREYPVGSCNYDAVLRHEDEHVAVVRRLVTEYRPRLLQAVTGLRLQSTGLATRANDESASRQVVASDVLSAVQGVIDELQGAMREANRLLDKRDTEKALKQCSSW